ncbi:glycosyltransferase family 2 protein [Paenibacillus sp. P22]|uniref:glycosyltransferase n=1 Tax=Paenibacillus sp. P22 TaxID=483908 RepID=UPI00069F3730|nr:glycosyltransferase family 2 protein [Paenibacillus sp. P22]
MAAILAALTGALAVQLLFVLWNRRYLVELGEPSRHRGGRQEAGGRNKKEAESRVGSARARARADIPLEGYKVMPSDISILVPARNEERNIGDCLQSLLALRGRPHEILVLDDHSEDGTASIVSRIAGDPESGVKLLQGGPLPEGWMGKSHACSQLAEAASGRWLLFVDADVRLGPDALEAAAAEASLQRSGLVSGFPRQETGGWMERLVVSMMMFTILIHLPLRLVSRSDDPRFAAANGAFIFVEARSYERMGGHGAVRESLLDDMDLIRQAKLRGEPVRLARIDRVASMRMYRSPGEVWSGYRKNLFPGLGRSLPLMGFVFIVYALLYLAPPAALLGGLAAWAVSGAAPLWLGWAASAAALGMAVKTAADLSSGLPAWYGMFVPASIVLTIFIGLDSARVHYAGSGYEWKGRRYA